MAIVWLWFDQLLAPDSRGVGGEETIWRWRNVCTSSYTQKQVEEYKSTYPEKFAV